MKQEVLERIQKVVEERLQDVLNDYTRKVEELNEGLERLRAAQSVDTRPRNVEEEEAYIQTARLFQAVTQGNREEMRAAVEALEKRGFYGDYLEKWRSKGYATRDGFSTTDAAPFIPVIIMDRILELVPEYGFAARNASVFRMTGKTMRMPYAAAVELPVYYADEEGEIKTNKLAFSSVEFSPRKFGVIAPWTTELEEDAQIQYTQRIMRAVAVGIAKKMDTILLTANGEVDNGGWTGLLNDANVATHTLSGGNTTYASVTIDDLLAAQSLFSDSVPLDNLVGVLHRTVDNELRMKKDSSGRYYFEPARLDEANAPRRNRIVIGDVVFERSPVMPKTTDASQAGKPFIVMGDFRYAFFGIRRDTTVTLLTEATIKDVAGTGTINLATQDSRALRITTRFAYVPPPIYDPFVKVQTSAT